MKNWDEKNNLILGYRLRTWESELGLKNNIKQRKFKKETDKNYNYEH